MCGYLWVCIGMYGYGLEFDLSKQLSSRAGPLNLDPSLVLLVFTLK